MGKGYLIDTNIAIYLLDGNMPIKAVNFLSHIIDNENDKDFDKIPNLNYTNPYNF
jgi:predicted nucleic acid-binding protein